MKRMAADSFKVHCLAVMDEVQAKREAIVITKHGKPAGILVGFASEDEWFDYKLEHDPRFLRRIARARESLRAGKGVKLEDFDVGAQTHRRRTRRCT